MEIQDIKTGTIITGPKRPEPVEIKRVDYSGDYFHIVGATTISTRHIDQLIPSEELSDISVKTMDTDFKSQAWKVFLALESKRYRFASLYDPLLAMNASKVDPLPPLFDICPITFPYITITSYYKDTCCYQWKPIGLGTVSIPVSDILS